MSGNPRSRCSPPSASRRPPLGREPVEQPPDPAAQQRLGELYETKLEAWDKRGAKSSNMRFALADGIMHAHTSEMPVGTYKKGHRHGPDFHVLTLKGEGYSLF